MSPEEQQKVDHYLSSRTTRSYDTYTIEERALILLVVRIGPNSQKDLIKAFPTANLTEQRQYQEAAASLSSSGIIGFLQEANLVYQGWQMRD